MRWLINGLKGHPGIPVAAWFTIGSGLAVYANTGEYMAGLMAVAAIGIPAWTAVLATAYCTGIRERDRIDRTILSLRGGDADSN